MHRSNLLWLLYRFENACIICPSNIKFILYSSLYGGGYTNSIHIWSQIICRTCDAYLYMKLVCLVNHWNTLKDFFVIFFHDLKLEEHYYAWWNSRNHYSSSSIHCNYFSFKMFVFLPLVLLLTKGIIKW
jgi:hypothetical protein